MKKIFALSLILVATLIFTACASKSESAPMPGIGGGAPAESFESMPASAPEAAYDQSVVSKEGAGAPAASVERLVIQNADLTIVVSDVKGRMENIQVMAQQMGGYVVSSNLYQGYTNDRIPMPEAKVTIRVPAEKLDEALEQVKKDVVEVQNETRSGQDVTAEYVDLQSRLKNYEAAEAQLEEIMKNATDTEDVVTIFNQLVYYREQIELVKGQMKYYEESAALSVINISIVAEESIQPVKIGKWEPQGVALEALQDLINFLKGFINFLIYFVILILPVLIIIFGLFYLVFLGLRAVFRLLRGKKPTKELPQGNPGEKK